MLTISLFMEHTPHGVGPLGSTFDLNEGSLSLFGPDILTGGIGRLELKNLKTDTLPSFFFFFMGRWLGVE